MPGADTMGVFPLALEMFGVAIGLARMPPGVAIAGKVCVPSAIEGTAISAMQWAQRPRRIVFSQDTVAVAEGAVRSVVRWRRSAQSQMSASRDGIYAARLRVSDIDWV